MALNETPVHHSMDLVGHAGMVSVEEILTGVHTRALLEGGQDAVDATKAQIEEILAGWNQPLEVTSFVQPAQVTRNARARTTTVPSPTKDIQAA